MAASLFSRLTPQPVDPLLGLIAAFRADPRPDKIDLGVGVYRDETGRTPVLETVKAAERRLAETQKTKAYLGSEGNLGYAAALTRLVMGEKPAGPTRCVQTPGGTGALRLAMDAIARAKSGARVWVGTPTWPNHFALLAAAGLEACRYRYFDPATGTVCFDEMTDALGRAAPGDVVLVHGCCHNPSGADLAPDQAKALADLMAGRGLLPLIDLAYQGLGRDFDADGATMRLILDRCGEGLVAYSCDKNFALYRERVGGLFVRTQKDATADAVFSNLLSCARSNWSMPPDHGAAVVETVLDDPELHAAWQKEVTTMRGRIRELRAALAALSPAFAPVAGQNGMFSLLPVSPDQVAALQRNHGIYMAASGRINVAGFTKANLAAFAAAYRDVTK